MPSIIEEIASELNISIASVSRALNDRPGVGQALRERILAKARELNYSPSMTARGMATSQTFTLGFFIHEKPGLSPQTDPFYSEIMHGAEQILSETDYHLAIATLSDETMQAADRFRFVREKRIDGMILAGPDISPKFIMAMMQTGLPVVLVDNRLEYVPSHCVNSDDIRGGLYAAQHLIECGHQHIGIISGPQEWPSNARRLSGYQQALRQAGLDMPTVYTDRTTIESGEEAYQQLVAECPEITAICAVNDSMAIGAIRAAEAEGRHVPNDLAVIGFDDISWASLNKPPLSTIRIPKNQLGREAASRLISMLENPDMPPTELTIAVELIKRASTKAAF